MWRLGLLVLCCAAAPVQAAVVVNEIAWMGSADSANDEWIELYNSGGDTPLDGWILTDGEALSITLTGTIAAGQYAVLERTDDTTAPGAAFLVYTGALGNDGRTLTLRRADSAIEDQVAGGTDWNSVGGDNTTKETAQLTTNGWVTGTPTPGKVNVTSGTTENNDDNETSDEENETANKDTSTSKTTSSSKNEHISLVVPDDELILTIDTPKTTFVNQTTPLLVTGSGISEKLIPSLSYTWNLGNLTTATGSALSVVYKKPGEYVVIVEGRYGRHYARARQVLSVLPTPLSLARDTEGTLLINNDASYEVDISRFVLKGKTTRTIPPQTYLAPRGSLPVTDNAFASSYFVTLSNSAKQVIATLPIQTQSSKPPETTEENSAPTVAVLDLSPVPQPKISALATSRAATEPGMVIPLALVSATPTPPTNQMAAALTGSRIPREKLPYLGLIGLIMIGTLAVYTQKRNG